MLKRYVTTCFALLLVLLIPDAASAGRLQSKAQRIILSAGLDDTRVAVLVKDLDSEQILLDINSSEPMIPASNMKLVVSAAALDLLGPDFVFRTELRLIRPNDWRQLPLRCHPPSVVQSRRWTGARRSRRRRSCIL